jgi:hypothetical protein
LVALDAKPAHEPFAESLVEYVGALPSSPAWFALKSETAFVEASQSSAWTR